MTKKVRGEIPGKISITKRKDSKMRKPRQLATKIVRKGVAQMIRLQDGDSKMGWIYVAYNHNGQVCIYEKFQKGDEWKCISNSQKVKIGFPGDSDDVKVKATV